MNGPDTYTNHKSKVFFENVCLVCTSTSLLDIQAHKCIPLSETSSKLYRHGLQAVSTMSHVIHSILFLNQHNVEYSRQTPS